MSQIFGEDIRGVITEIKRFATHDGPGIRTTVFIKGCPLRCRWCCNPETWTMERQLYYISKRCQGYGACVRECSAGALSMDKENKVDREKCTRCMKCVAVCPNQAFVEVGKEYSVAEVVAEVERDLPFYGDDGGITLSGGEPFYQARFSLAILRACKERGITTVLDTTAYTSPENLESALQWTDLFLLDIKHMDPQKHREGTGVSNELILENARLLARSGRVRISLPLIPDFNDSEENLRRTAEFARELGIAWIDLNPLHKLGTGKYGYLGMQSPYASFRDLTKEDVARAKAILEECGLKVSVGRMM